MKHPYGLQHKSFIFLLCLLASLILTVCHAAVNAIANRTILDLTGCTIYLTQCPDEDCAHLIAQSGITEVKYMRNVKRGNRDHEENAKRILSLERVSIKYVKLINNYNNYQ